MGVNGILLLDKDEGWTSQDCVSKLRGILGERRIGHAGTLDPLATGLLVVLVGRATRAAAFAEAVVGKPHEYEIPESAYPAKACAVAKKGVLKMAADACCEGERCLNCNTVCENCADSCPNRANVVVKLADGRHQIVHIDKMCNECGNCTQFCPYASEPCRDKFTLFQTAEDMADSKNAGVLFLGGDMVRVRMADVKDYDLSKPNQLPAELEMLILRIRSHYSYLYK